MRVIYIECVFINLGGCKILDVDNCLYIFVYYKFYYCNKCFMINY